MSKEQLIGRILSATPDEIEKITAIFEGRVEQVQPVAPLDRRLYTITGAGEVLGVSPMTIRRMIADRRLKAIETRAGRRRIASAELTRYLTEGGK
jgi:excisionase family DNA binding protein